MYLKQYHYTLVIRQQCCLPSHVDLQYVLLSSLLRLPGSERSILYPWIIVHLVVTLLVGLAWVLVSTSPDVDYMEGKFSPCVKIKIVVVALLSTSKHHVVLICADSLIAMKIEHPNVEEKGSVNA